MMLGLDLEKIIDEKFLWKNSWAQLVFMIPLLAFKKTTDGS